MRASIGEFLDKTFAVKMGNGSLNLFSGSSTSVVTNRDLNKQLSFVVSDEVPVNCEI